MLDDATVQLYCTLLHKDLSVLEWGCGGSTVYFSRYVNTLHVKINIESLIISFNLT